MTTFSLEKELKVRLFVRNTKTVNLSEDGKTLYQYARQMIELEQEIQSMFSKAAEQKERCITIATSTIPAQYILPDILVNHIIFGNEYILLLPIKKRLAVGQSVDMFGICIV